MKSDHALFKDAASMEDTSNVWTNGMSQRSQLAGSFLTAVMTNYVGEQNSTWHPAVSLSRYPT